jgi:hypothetical protein
VSLLKSGSIMAPTPGRKAKAERGAASGRSTQV